MTTIPIRPCETLPARGGVGLKPQQLRAVLDALPDVGFFEVHAENFMVEGGPILRQLDAIRERYPLSLHGVGLSIGGVAPLDEGHLRRLARLVERYRPAAFSEHLAWSSHAGAFFNDLLPVPYEASTLRRVCDHIEQVQDHLRLRLLLENPATYLLHAASTMSEGDLLSEVVRRTGCGLLLDVSNAYLSSVNHALDAQAAIQAMPLHAVGELHVAGFARDADAVGAPLLIDHHGSPVDDAVWALLAWVARRVGPMPVLLERDNDVPPLAVLAAEARRAEDICCRDVTARTPEAAW